MRRITCFDRISADGYFAAADGGLDWVVPEPALDSAALARMPETDTILFGRRTYQQFEGFWRHSLDDTATGADPHVAGRQSPELHAMAAWINAATKYVFSRTLSDVTWQESRLLRRFDASELAALKARPGKNIMVFGSGSLATQLAESGLIDEYQFVVTPTLLGTGRPLLSGIPRRTKLNLLEATAYPSGNVMLRYEPSL